jgi:transposase-like protein
MYCLQCQKEYEKEMFCPECGRMLVNDNTFNYEKNENNLKNYIEEELLQEKQRIKQEQEKIRQQDKQNLPKCPTCGSTNIRHISSTERGVNAVMFGFFGNKRKCQFECLNPNCRYRW